MSDKPNKWLIIAIAGCGGVASLFAISSLIAAMLAVLGPRLGLQSTQTPMFTQSRSIADISEGLTEVWRIRDLSIPYSPAPTLMHSTKTNTAIVQSSEDPMKLRLCLLSNDNGAEIWCQSGIPPVHSIADNGRLLFLAVDWELRAYELTTGHLAWRSGGLPSHTQYLIVPNPLENLKIYSTEEDLDGRRQIIRIVDAETGAISKVQSIDVRSNVRLLKEGDEATYWGNGNSIWATEGLEGARIWQQEIGGRIQYWPIESNEVVVVSVGAAFSELIGLDVSTGRLDWESPVTIVSNVSSHDEQLYAIGRNGAFVSFDLVSGEIRQEFQFIPSHTDNGVRSNAYLVQIEEPEAFLYFGDSNELIALRGCCVDTSQP